VHIVGADGRLQPEMLRNEALQALDRRKCDLIQVAPPEGGSRGAICRIVTKAEQQARLKAARATEAALRRAQKDKGVSIGWSINAHDLAFKLEKVQAYLEKGYSVAVNFTWKRSKQVVPPRQRQQILRAVAERVSQIPDVKEYKREGDVNRGLFTVVYKVPRAGRGAQQGEESEAPGYDDTEDAKSA
jgi:translation initiation factor IF-3